MSMRIGVKEFRDRFTAIALQATAPVIVTDHDKVVGYYMPSYREPPSEEDIAELCRISAEMRRGLEQRGVDVDTRLREAGLTDEDLA